MKFYCPECNAEIKLKSPLYGNTIKCSSCHKTVDIPSSLLFSQESKSLNINTPPGWIRFFAWIFFAGFIISFIMSVGTTHTDPLSEKIVFTISLLFFVAFLVLHALKIIIKLLIEIKNKK